MNLPKHDIALIAAVLSFLTSYLMFKFAEDTDVEGEMPHKRLGRLTKFDDRKDFDSYITTQKVMSIFFLVLSILLAFIACR